MFNVVNGLFKATVGVALTPVALVSDAVKIVVEPSKPTPSDTGQVVDLVKSGVKEVFTGKG